MLFLFLINKIVSKTVSILQAFKDFLINQEVDALYAGLDQIIGKYKDLGKQLNESSNLTYHELRTLLTIIARNTKDSATKRVLTEILYVLGALEVKNVPVPTMRRYSGSKKVFPYS